MQALCGLQGIFDLFNCKTPVKQMTPSVLQCLFYRHLLPGMTGHDP